jgi:hypothetical protein
MDAWLIVLCGVVTGLSVIVLVYVCLIRPWYLRWGTTDTEARASLPGDNLVPRPKSEATHAITINAPPARVWPWRVQLGQDRAEFYSYACLENVFGCYMRNAFQIIEAWQQLAVGDRVLFHPKMARVPVAVLQPEHALVIGGPLDHKTGLPNDRSEPPPEAATAWAFVLHEADAGQSRLLVRLRGCWPAGLRGWFMNRLFWEPAHFIMERKMLLTRKRLAEVASAAARTTRNESVAWP